MLTQLEQSFWYGAGRQKGKTYVGVVYEIIHHSDGSPRISQNFFLDEIPLERSASSGISIVLSFVRI